MFGNLAISASVSASLAVFADAGATINFAPPSFIIPGHGVIAVEAPDLDSDGDDDLLVASIGAPVSVMRNLGDGAFGVAEPYSIEGTHLDMVVTDLNGDGHADVALANFGSGTVSVALNQGDGTLAAAQTSPAPGTAFTRGLAAGDLDGDGDQDLMVGDGATPNKAVLLNNGNGVFDQALPFAAGGSTIAIALGDLDDDGDLDAVTIFSGTFLHLNNGNGTFAPPMMLNAPSGTAVAIADLNSDRLQDIVVARSSQGVNLAIVFLNSGSPEGGSFAQSSYVIDGLVRDIAVSDLDNDGDLDVASSHVSPENSVNVLTNHGDGTFAAALAFFPGIYPQSLAIADFDQDGRNDIVTANQFADPPSIGLLINQTPVPIAGDITGDNVVNVLDLLAVIGTWGPCQPPPATCPADQDANGMVNVLDLLIVIANWG